MAIFFPWLKIELSNDMITKIYPLNQKIKKLFLQEKIKQKV